jgi:quercetin 2,3-dioxygenase
MPTAVLLGGTPFEEDLLMWWNFVGRDHDEIVQARADWEADRRFGTVTGYPDDRLAAPALPTVRLMPRPATRG